MRELARKAWPVVLMLLASATTAHAECAWVRWINTWGFEAAQGWALGNAYGSKAECMADIARALDSDKKVAAAEKKQGVEWELRSDGAQFIDSARGRIGGWRYFCYPDTIDPRGPKGK